MSRTAFLIVFVTLLIGQPKDRYLRHWTVALVSSTLGLSTIIGYGDTQLPLGVSLVGYTLLLLSLTASWTGLRLFYGHQVQLYVIPLMTLLPSSLYVLASYLGVAERINLSFIYFCATAIAVLAWYEIMRTAYRGVSTQYIVAVAFGVYALVLLLSGLLTLLSELPTDRNANSLPSMLFDQVSSVLVYFGYIAMSGERARIDLKLRAETDPLTAVGNRRGGQPILERWHVLTSSGKRCSVLLGDIDRFKTINDSLGHEVGDAVLVGVAARLGSALRKHDTLIRWGGEEFLIILPDTGLEHARVLASRLLGTVGNEAFQMNEHRLPVTLSMGVAEMASQDTSYEASVTRADKALYRAKREGRNRVCCEPRDPPPGIVTS